jgi:hypothetical protein
MWFWFPGSPFLWFESVAAYDAEQASVVRTEICSSYVGRYRPFLSQVSLDQGHIIVSTPQGSLPKI